MLRAVVENARRIRIDVREALDKASGNASDRPACATCGDVLYGSDLYMLRDQTWVEICAKANVSPEDTMMCLLCASLHHGRAFQLEDFSPAPVNRTVRAVWWFATSPRSIGPARRP
jgi:hypothetical protein